MSTQYDAIGQSYESLKHLPAALLERDNLRSAISPFLSSAPSGASVLDLACGTGYYSRLLLSWGAARVVGVDISRAMVSAAQDAARAEGLGDNLSFQVGDCASPLTLDSGPFDVVLGAWLLNYASSGAEMAAMFRNASSHLAPGGHFVGITPHPAPDLDAFAEHYDATKSNRDMRKYGVSTVYASRLDSGEGYATKVTGHLQPVEIEFHNFHLKREVYEKAAREGGMLGELEWRRVEVPRAQAESLAAYGVGEDFWDGYHEVPHMGILVVQK